MTIAPGAMRTQLLDSALCVAFEIGDEPCGPGVIDTAAVACNVNVDDLWSHLADGIDWWPRAAAIPDAPVEYARRWILSDDPGVAAAAALHSGLTAEELDVMIDTWTAVGNLYPMRAALANPNVNPATLQRFFGSSDGQVQRQIAANPITPHDMLRRYATSPDVGVQTRVAANVATPADILAELVGQGNHWVQWHVAKNPNVPTSVLKCLGALPTSYVSKEANRALKERVEQN